MKKSQGRGRRGKGTWRTNDQFGATKTILAGSAEQGLIVGNIPQAPVTAGMPEPISEYEVSQVLGGLEVGQVTPVAALTANTQLLFGFGVYQARWDPAIPGWTTLDPLNSTDVCQDQWVSLDWMNWDVFSGLSSPTSPFTYPSAGVKPTHARPYRFNMGRRTLKEGQALLWSLSIASNTLIANVTFFPYFRYHVHMVA